MHKTIINLLMASFFAMGKNMQQVMNQCYKSEGYKDGR